MFETKYFWNSCISVKIMKHTKEWSQYKQPSLLSVAKTFWKMYSLTEFSQKSYLCCGHYLYFYVAASHLHVIIIIIVYLLSFMCTLCVSITFSNAQCARSIYYVREKVPNRLIWPSAYSLGPTIEFNKCIKKEKTKSNKCKLTYIYNSFVLSSSHNIRVLCFVLSCTIHCGIFHFYCSFENMSLL